MNEELKREYESRFNPFNNPEKIKKDVEDYLKIVLSKMTRYKYEVDIDKDNFYITIRLGEYMLNNGGLTFKNYLIVKYNCIDKKDYWYFPKEIDEYINNNEFKLDKENNLYDIQLSKIGPYIYYHCYMTYIRYAYKIYSFLYKFYMEGIKQEN